jgi:YHS domain-containing protein
MAGKAMNGADDTHGGSEAATRRIASLLRIDRQSGVLKAKIIVLLAMMLAAHPGPVLAQSYSHDQEIVSDPLTGAALMGHDPVAYFIENRAEPGDPALQASFAGRAWYFTSAANRLAFLEKPESFMPAFGGHDAAAMAAGVLRAGDPKLFLRLKDRLYFFRDSEARDRMLAQPELIDAATREWPQLRRDLEP